MGGVAHFSVSVACSVGAVAHFMGGLTLVLTWLVTGKGGGVVACMWGYKPKVLLLAKPLDTTSRPGSEVMTKLTK